MENDLKYTPSNQSVCQQISLSLTYDDGNSLLPKRCDQDESYFACDIPCKLHCVFEQSNEKRNIPQIVKFFSRKEYHNKLCDRDCLSKIKVKLAITNSREKILRQRSSLALNCYLSRFNSTLALHYSSNCNSKHTNTHIQQNIMLPFQEKSEKFKRKKKKHESTQ